MKLKYPTLLLSVLLPISAFANTKLPKDKFEDALFERDMEIAKSFQDLSNDPQNGINTCYTYTLLKEKHEFVKKNSTYVENDYSLQKVLLSEKPLIAQFESILKKNKIPCEIDSVLSLMISVLAVSFSDRSRLPLTVLTRLG